MNSEIAAWDPPINSEITCRRIRADATGAWANQEFIIVSHSLGDYLIFSALDMDQMSTNTANAEQTRNDFQEILKHCPGGFPHKPTAIVGIRRSGRAFSEKYRDASQGLEQGSLRISQVPPWRARAIQASTNRRVEQSE
jgi:hypothetical protein